MRIVKLILVCHLSVAFGCFEQRFTLKGVVADEEGLPLDGAHVVILNADNQFSKDFYTGESGVFAYEYKDTFFYSAIDAEVELFVEKNGYTKYRKNLLFTKKSIEVTLIEIPQGACIIAVSTGEICATTTSIDCDLMGYNNVDWEVVDFNPGESCEDHNLVSTCFLAEPFCSDS